jgi:hypothetical protein
MVGVVRLATFVSQARASRPLIRTPHVPHEACMQEWRITNDGSWRRLISISTLSTVAPGSGVHSKSSKCGFRSPVRRREIRK